MRKRPQELHFSFKFDAMTKPREIGRPPRRASAGAALPRFALHGEAPACELRFGEPAYFNRQRRTGAANRTSPRPVNLLPAPPPDLAT